tara:strand:+ start:1379 stop:1555 length:177 start_codon:yes stop_codon:yes gene_type:complete
LSGPFDLNSVQAERTRVVSPETLHENGIDANLIKEKVKGNEFGRNTINNSRNSSSAHP